MGRKVTVTIDVTESGRKGGTARAKNMTAAELSQSASDAASARWEEYYRQHPEKLEEKKRRDAAKAAAAKRKAKKAGRKR